MDMQVLREINLFKNLDAVQLAHIASVGRQEDIKKNAVLFREGDAAEYFYVISRGRVRISKFVPGFGEEALAILDQGTYFGEMELVDPSLPRTAHAIAHEDCRLQLFPIHEFHELLKVDMELALAVTWNLLHTMSHRLRETDNKVAAMFAMAQFQ